MAERVTVPTDLAGVRADRVLAVLAGVSRSVARQLIEAGSVTVAGVPVDRSTRLNGGDEILYQRPPEVAPLVAEEVPFRVILESVDVLVVDKPAGVVVHPGAGNARGTLANGLIHRFPELAALGADHRWGLVHRLDRDTSGLLLVARNAEMHAFLQSELKARRVRRSYLALVVGHLDAATGTIDAPVGRDPAHPTRMAILRTGRPARTHYRRIADWDEVTLVEVELETGRTHQIRVHFASIGRAVVGDSTYGSRLVTPGDPGRTWLHAARIRFPRPDGSHETATAALPPDLRSTFAELGKPRSGQVPAG